MGGEGERTPGSEAGACISLSSASLILPRLTSGGRRRHRKPSAPIEGGRASEPTWANSLTMLLVLMA